MDLTSVIESVKIETRTAKTGKPYYMLVTTFVGGYEKEDFLNADQKYILEDIFAKNS